jgi:Tol biopolymer transport system component
MKTIFSFTLSLILISFISTKSFSQNKTYQAVKTKRVTNVLDSYPMLSPDGKIVTFQSNRTDDWDIYIQNSDGTNLKNITNSKGDDVNPIWSPDGTKIVFTSSRDNDEEIYLMNADGSTPIRLTNAKGDDSHPHWFPDGKKIIFNSARNTPDLSVEWRLQHIEVFSMNIDGTNLTQITDFKTINTYPSVSPDAKKITFRRVTDSFAYNWDMSNNVRNRNSEVFVMDIDGKNLINISNSPAYDGWPWWSPDSQKLVFSSNRDGRAYVGQLYIVNVDGTDLKKLIDIEGGVVQPTWSKNGKSIYAHQYWETLDYEYGNIISIDLQVN